MVDDLTTRDEGEVAGPETAALSPEAYRVVLAQQSLYRAEKTDDPAPICTRHIAPCRLDRVTPDSGRGD